MKRINVTLEDENATFLERFKKKNHLKNLDNTVNELIKRFRRGEC